jgi:hypothetical protein
MEAGTLAQHHAPSLPTFRVRVRVSATAMARRIWRVRWWIGLWAFYMVLGSWMMLHANMVPSYSDALSRFTHAYYVFHNDPPTLAAIGFVWPPVVTLVLLPFAVIGPIARSGVGMIVPSALGATLLAACVWSELKRLELPRPIRALLLGSLLLNPMVLYYAVNGMSEVWGLLFPTIATIALLRWFQSGTTVLVSIASIAGGLAVLSRYEIGAFVLFNGIAVVLWILLQERDIPKARATGVFFAMPVVYCVLTWMFFCWTIMGSPLWFLTNGGEAGTIAGTSDQHASIVLGVAKLLYVQAMLQPGVFVIGALLIAWAVIARQWIAFVLAGMLGYNALTQGALIVTSGNLYMTHLRFNMRAIPLVIVIGAWLTREVYRKRGATAGYAITAVLCATVALTVVTNVVVMKTWPSNFLEGPFLNALVTGHDQLHGTYANKTVQLGCTGERSMGSWIEHNVSKRNSILVEDSVNYSTVLFSGHPERFVDRIDKGDAYFIDQITRPKHSIGYVLVNEVKCEGRLDLVTTRFGDFAAHGAPGLRLEHRTGDLALYRITDHARIARSPWANSSDGLRTRVH